MIRWLEHHLAGRRFDFGGPTPEYTSTVFGHWYVERNQVAASVRWDCDESARTAIVKVGPVGLMVTFARRRLRPELAVSVEEPGTSWMRQWLLSSGGELVAWLNFRHLGVCVDVEPGGRMHRVEVGPFGVALVSA
jgi:hypothetical protein